MRRLRSPLAFLALSVLLHAVVLGAWLVLGPESSTPAPRPRPVVIEFEVREQPPAGTTAGDAAGSQPAPPRKPAVRRPTAPLTAQAPSAPGAPRATSAPDAPRTASDAPLATDVPRREGARKHAWLLPSSVPPGATDAPPAAGGLDEGLADVGPPSPADVARGAVTEGMARARRESGLVHAYYAVLGEALLGAWGPQARLSSEADFLSRGASPPQATALNAWLKSAQRYGSTGSPTEAPAVRVRRAPAAGPLDQETVERSTASIGAITREAKRQLEEGRRARVLVVQTCAGPLRQVRLLAPSQRPSVDVALLADLRRAGEGLPRPPAELCREDAVGSVWDFALVGAGELVGNPSGVLLRTRRLEGTKLAKLVHFVESR